MKTKNTQLLQNLQNQGECEWIEFKLNCSNPKLVGEYLSALSNGAALKDEKYGYLVYGIQDKDSKIVGTKYNPKKKIDRQEAISYWATRLTPRVHFTVDTVQTTNNKQVVIFKVDAAHERPVAFDGVEYIRESSYKKRLQKCPEFERHLWLKISGRSFEDQKAKSFDDNNELLSHLDYAQYFKMTRQPMPTSASKIILKLEEEGLIVPDNGAKAITNLGALLFATNLNKFSHLLRKMVRIVIYKNSSNLETLKEYENSKGYAVAFKQIISHVNEHLSGEHIKVLRSNRSMLPQIVIRELVANMLMHQDFYIKGMNPMVEIFSDRIEVSNSGKSLVATDRLVDHRPISRNEKLARLMRLLGMCEERGSGMNKIIDAIEKEALPAPLFKNEEQYFRAILYGPKALNKWSKSERLQAVYLHSCLQYKANKAATNASLRQRFQVDEKNHSSISRVIKEALEAKLIKEKDPDNKAPRYASYVPSWLK